MLKAVKGGSRLGGGSRSWGGHRSAVGRHKATGHVVQGLEGNFEHGSNLVDVIGMTYSFE